MNYKGYRIERCVAKQWNVYQGDTLLDATSTLAEAKYLINCWLDAALNARRVEAKLFQPIA